MGKWGRIQNEGGAKCNPESGGAEGILYTSFLCPTPPPSMADIHPFSPLRCNHPDTFQAPLGPSTQLGKRRWGRVDQD